MDDGFNFGPCVVNYVLHGPGHAMTITLHGPGHAMTID